jgi:predicted nucleic acid-binding protein
MTTAFPEAMIEGYESLIPSMPNDDKDRHALAAAVFGKADAIITVDRRGFPPDILKTFDVEPLTPDEFLIHQWHLDPEQMKCKVLTQSAIYRKNLDAHLKALSRMVPKFMALFRDCNGDIEEDSEEQA